MLSQTFYSIQVFQGGVPFAPSPLPLPHAKSQADEIAQQFTKLSKTTSWKQIQRLPLEELEEPEGLVRVGQDRIFISHNRYTERTGRQSKPVDGFDRTAGAGFGAMTVYTGQGKPIAKLTLNAPGDIEYHIGGLEYDGKYIWATMSQYRPASASTIYRIEPRTLIPTPIMRVDDHAGAIVSDADTGAIAWANWGAREWSYWNVSTGTPQPLPGLTRPPRKVRNPSHFVDYQDAKNLGRVEGIGNGPLMLCAGLNQYGDLKLGGVGLVEVDSLRPVWEVPVTVTTAKGASLFQNPMDVDLVDGSLRFHVAPDQDGLAEVLVYEPQV